MPQIIMLSHAAWVNHERLEERVQRKSGKNSGYDYSPPNESKPVSPYEAAHLRRKTPEEVSDPYAHGDPTVLGNKRLSELDMKEFAYYMSMPF